MFFRAYDHFIKKFKITYISKLVVDAHINDHFMVVGNPHVSDKQNSVDFYSVTRFMDRWQTKLNSELKWEKPK